MTSSRNTTGRHGVVPWRSILSSIISCRKSKHNDVFIHSFECHLSDYFHHCFETWAINTKINLSWAHKPVATAFHIWLFNVFAVTFLTNMQLWFGCLLLWKPLYQHVTDWLNLMGKSHELIYSAVQLNCCSDIAEILGHTAEPFWTPTKYLCVHICIDMYMYM